ncbi:hypothetical protein H0H93_000541 [Arthromyces matolae]|nr:hypothetical protein H0H93_000541 [Arthromyces matolae]
MFSIPTVSLKRPFLRDNALGSGIRVESKGVYTVVSDISPHAPWTLPSTEMFRSLAVVMGVLFCRAPWLLALNIICELFVVASPVLSLVIGREIFSLIQGTVISKTISEDEFCRLLLLIYALIGVYVATFILKDATTGLAQRLAGHLRLYASQFSATLTAQEATPRPYRVDPDFQSIRGFDFPSRFLRVMRHYSALICSFIALTYITLHVEGSDKWLLFIVLLRLPYNIYKALRTTVSSVPSVADDDMKGFNIFTDDVSFLRLCGLHRLVFDPQYAENLAKDGVKTTAISEYRHYSELMGPISDSFQSIALGPRARFIQVIIEYILTYPSLTILWTPLIDWSPFSLSAIAFSLYASFITGPLLESASFDFVNGSFKDILIDAHDLVLSLSPQCPCLVDEPAHDHEQGSVESKTLHFPENLIGYRPDPAQLPVPKHQITAVEKAQPSLKAWVKPDIVGVKLSFNNVAIEQPFVRNVSFTAQPGSLVLVVGDPGSGKTALVESLLGLSQPTAGQILIDGKPFFESDVVDTLRQETTFHTQRRELVYPLNVANNIMWGHDSFHDHYLAEEVAKATGLEYLFSKAAAVVGLPYSIYQSTGQGFVGTQTRMALDLVGPCLKENYSITLSSAQEQRVTA